MHFWVTLDIFGLFEEARTNQKVPKWIELVIYSTERLRAFLGLLTVEPIQKFNYLELLDLSLDSLRATATSFLKVYGT